MIIRLATLVCGLCSVSALAAQGRIVVGPTVPVSAVKGWEHSEYTADADPANANRVMVCSMKFSQTRNQLTSVLYTSDDAGKSWRIALDDSISRFNGVWDPACAYGLNGQAVFITLIIPDTARGDTTHYDRYQWWRMGGDENMHVHRSADAGRTWQPPVLLSFIDYESLTIDRTNGPYRGRMYIYGNTGGPGLWLIYSTDSGRTWLRSERTDVDGAWPRGGTISPKGTLLIPVQKSERSANNPTATPTSFVGVSASTDGGVHIDLPVTVAPLRDGCAGSYIMSSDHSAGPFRGRIYIVWSQKYRGRCAVFVAHSDDDGKKWSTPSRASDARPLATGVKATERPKAQIAVAPNGAVGVTWYDDGANLEGRDARLRFAASLDGGDTWLPSAEVSTHGYVVKDPPELSAHTVSSGGGQRRARANRESDVFEVFAWPSARSYYPWNSAPGDYTGIAAGADGAFHTFWIDNRSGTGEVYTARVTVDGMVTKPEAALAPLVNVTSAVEVQFTQSVWDPRARTLSWNYQLFNSSKDTILPPLKLRVEQLESDLGIPSLVLDGGQTGGVGTVIDVSAMLPAGGLRPGQLSAPRPLRVKLDDVRDAMSIMQRDIVHMQLKLYGTRRGPPKTKADTDRY